MPSGYHYNENGELVSNFGPNKGPFKSRKYARDPLLDPFEEAELEIVQKYASLHCSDVEIAHRLNFNYKEWLKIKEEHPEIQETIDRGVSDGKIAIRVAGLKKVQEGDTQMIIFLHKTILGYQNGDTLNFTQNLALIGDISQEAKDHLIHLTKHIYGSRPDNQAEAETQPAKPAKLVSVDFNDNDAQAQSD